MSLLLAAMLATSLVGAGVNLGPAGLASFANYSLIQDPEKQPENLGFGGKFTLGYLATNSMTSSTSFNAEVLLGYNTLLWQHRLTLQAVYSSVDSTTVAEQYFGAWQSNRLLSERSYVFGYAGYIHDRFSGYVYQGSAVVGYGIKALETKSQELKFELGAGWTRAKENGGSTLSSAAARLREIYSWSFGESSSLAQSLTLEKSSFNLYSRFDTKVTAQLIGNLAFVVAYTIQHNSHVTLGNPHTTSITSISLQYVFGGIFTE
ncbi:MAG: DUF481 domain-containing protein [Gammaproteobacteria bacterium]|nr:DUF481 domain-containing protein [Gammaproteobacteria bacterium]